MARPILLAFLLLAAPSFTVPPARAQGTSADSLFDYKLTSPPSAFEWGCYAPCMCPILVRTPLVGSFKLHRRTDPSPVPPYVEYDVSDVEWEANGGTEAVRITGAGTYRWGGEFALMEQLTLDLSFNGQPPQHFDSGLRPVSASFPEISTRISLHDEFCRDSVLVVAAQRIQVTGIRGGAGPSSLTAAPSPFGAATRIAFTLARAGWVQLTVYDVAGRRVRLLADREWLDTGSYVRVWDGRLDTGAVAPPGIYLVRLDSAAGRLIHGLAKVK